MTGSTSGAFQPMIYLAAIRRRWRLVLVLTVLGGLAGATLGTRSGGGPAPVVPVYWTAAHRLVIEGGGDRQDGINLLQVALSVTGGDVPDAVARRLGGEPDDLASRVRTVTDAEIGVIEVSAVAEDPDDARSIADAFADGLIDHLGAQRRGAHESAVAQARAEVDVRGERIRWLDEELRGIEDLMDAISAAPIGSVPDADSTRSGESLPRNPSVESAVVASEYEREQRLDELADQQQILRTQRWSRWERYGDALETLDDLERAGPGESPMRTQIVIDPLEISEAEFDRRLVEGRRGVNNFAAGELEAPLTAAGPSRSLTSPTLVAVMGTVLGLSVAVSVVMVQARIDTTLRSRRDVEAAFDMPVLTEVPPFESRQLQSIHAVAQNRSSVTEAYRIARGGLMYGGAHAGTPEGGAVEGDAIESRVVLVTSAGTGEGKSTTAANLAVLFAEAGHQVLAINCHHRRPYLHTLFGRRYRASHMLDSGCPGVKLVADVVDPLGHNPTSVVDAQRALVTRAREHFDLVLLDAGPLLATDEASSLLPVVDVVVVVAREGVTDRADAEEVSILLRRRGAAVAGIVYTESSGVRERRSIRVRVTNRRRRRGQRGARRAPAGSAFGSRRLGAT